MTPLQRIAINDFSKVLNSKLKQAGTYVLIRIMESLLWLNVLGSFHKNIINRTKHNNSCIEYRIHRIQYWSNNTLIEYNIGLIKHGSNTNLIYQWYNSNQFQYLINGILVKKKFVLFNIWWIKNWPKTKLIGHNLDRIEK